MRTTKKKKSAQDVDVMNTKTGQTRKRKKKRHTFGKILAVIQIILCVGFFVIAGRTMKKNQKKLQREN